jgi:CRP-like cAMP-binding protein
MRRTPDAKIERLGKVELFRLCSPKELHRLATIADEAILEAGQVFCRQGEVALACYVIVDGAATVTVGGQPVGVVGPGETVGEMGLIDRRPRSATVVARTPMQVYAIDARRFDSVLAETPGFARNLLRELSRRIRELDLARTAEPIAS